MKKTFISALILTALFTVTGCEDKEAKATIAQQTQTIAQLTAENTQLKAEKEKAEKIIPAIIAGITFSAFSFSAFNCVFSAVS